MNIEFLADHARFAPTLARWHHEEWGALMPYWSEADALSEFQSHTRRAGVPTTLVALDHGTLAGSVSLIADDLQEWKGKYSPWLASLYVVPAFRGRGIGSALVEEITRVARECGVSTLYVVAARSEMFYAALGWRVVERAVLHGVEAAVMVLDFQ